MNKRVITAFLVVFPLVFYGQQATPVFRTAEDSTHYAKISEMIEKNVARVRQLTSFTQAQADSFRYVVDSLYSIQQEIINRSLVRWHYRYSRNSDFTSYEDLIKGLVHPDSIIKLSLSAYHGEKLPDSLLLCRNLVELELINTSIAKIQKQLNTLTKLRSLYIYNNHPKQPLVVERNRYINFLRISGDPAMLPDFKKFKKLDSLDLRRNSLTFFPSIHKNRKLKVVSLSDNMLTLDNVSLKKNKHVEYLYLRRNKITTVPAALAKFKNLKGIAFAENLITTIEPGFGRLKRLNQLSLYKNELTSVPDAVYRLTNLKELDLYYNQIGRIDTNLCQLKNLKVLYASHNRIYCLPDCIGELTNLRKLYVHHNMLTTLPTGLGKLAHLETLRINHNLFTAFPQAALSLPILQTLDISHNYLTELPTEISALTTLHMLSIAGNPWSEGDLTLCVVKKIREKGTTVLFGAGESLPDDH